MDLNFDYVENKLYEDCEKCGQFISHTCEIKRDKKHPLKALIPTLVGIVVVTVLLGIIARVMMPIV